MIALCLPLLLYLLIPLRAGMGVQDLHGSYANSWQGFWDHVLGRGYTGFFTPNALTVQHTFRRLVALVAGAIWFGWPGAGSFGHRLVDVERATDLRWAGSAGCPADEFILCRQLSGG